MRRKISRSSMRGEIRFYIITLPYYFAVINVKQNGHDVKLKEETKNKIAAFAPFEKVSLGSKLSGKDISIVSFDDYGVDREYKL